MTKEEIQLTVLTTMEEIALDPLEKNKIARALDAARYEVSSQHACRRRTLLNLILCFTVGIFIALVSVSAQMSAGEPKHRVVVPTVPAKPWWEFLFEQPMERHAT